MGSPSCPKWSTSSTKSWSNGFNAYDLYKQVSRINFIPTVVRLAVGSTFYISQVEKLIASQGN